MENVILAASLNLRQLIWINLEHVYEVENPQFISVMAQQPEGEALISSPWTRSLFVSYTNPA